MNKLDVRALKDDLAVAANSSNEASDKDDDGESSIGSHTNDSDMTGTAANSLATDGHHTTDTRGGSGTTIGKKETKDVLRLKLAVLLVLVTSSIAIATFVYFYLTYSEHEQFRQQFDDDSRKVLDAVGSALDKFLSSFDSVAVTLVSTAYMTNQSWPFVTMADHAVRMSKVLPLSGAVAMGAYPLVTAQQRDEWEAYAAENNGWVNQGMAIQAKWGGYHGPIVYDGVQNPSIFSDVGDVPRNETDDMLVVWQTFPVLPQFSYNWNALSIANPDVYLNSLRTHRAAIEAPYMVATENEPELLAEEKIWAEEIYSNFVGPDEEAREPMSDWIYPVINTVNEVRVAGASDYQSDQHDVVACLVGNVYWRSLIRNILPSGSNGIRVVFSNPCTNAFTYKLDGAIATYLGVGEHFESKYQKRGVTATLHALSDFAKNNSAYTGAPLDSEYCPITLHVYPSDEMKASFTSHNPIIFTLAVIVIFAFVSLVFALYDRMVERRQTTVMNTAVRSTAIVSSLFPAQVRDRLYPGAGEEASLLTPSPDTAKGKLHSFLRENRSTVNVNSDRSGSNMLGGAPIAELYPDTTVLFADISGFTSWSSERSPTQVFQLLETIYAAFDSIARRRGVFKVETIGDCYVAVVGLPTPRKNHAVIMARFAKDCRDKMASLITDELAKTLGPGTTELAMRFGMNSGPTTAGVLRGEKSRFQLFGDTVNTAARMESNGLRNKIQVSTKTADLIRAAGKGHWLTLREEPIECKGKGLLTTYWCEPSSSGSGASVVSASHNSEGGDDDTVEEPVDGVAAAPDAKIERLIEWNTSVFAELLGAVVSARASNSVAREAPDGPSTDRLTSGKPILEIREEISLRESSFAVRTVNTDHAALPVSAEVSQQLRELIGLIAAGYRSNPFHNFAHCSHVVMSTKKLLDRIATHEQELQHATQTVDGCAQGIASNPLAKLAIVFAALIHDMDHAGVSNAQLVQENDPLAIVYAGQSVAEQNSVDQAWSILIQPQFVELRRCIWTTDAELKLFRQIVVNAVMATDLFDKDLKAMREMRWSKACAGNDSVPWDKLRTFVKDNDGEGGSDKPDSDFTNRRATIIIELVIQASDVSHTMQHFTVYKKWNMRLLAEMYSAYQNGRMTKDPTIGWYEGELWFFDHYVIPLAQKLRQCGVFGVSCDEFLDYAVDNRAEWEVKGREIVEEAKKALLLQPLACQGTVVEI